ncbi:hypothetical protein KY308_02520, partial [Candidatus Woesearchaeota archaeon]|nr:hypothetical protein [Candidatus Woesearchaeota archaeon]
SKLDCLIFTSEVIHLIETIEILEKEIKTNWNPSGDSGFCSENEVANVADIIRSYNFDRVAVIDVGTQVNKLNCEVIWTGKQ